MRKALPVLVALCAAVCIVWAVTRGAPHAKADASCGGLIAMDPVEGISKKPADAPQASLVVRYSLPQFEPSGECAQRINQHYLELTENIDRLGLEEGEAELTSETACHSQRYLSIVLRLLVSGAQGDSERLLADTFALDGVYAGQKLTLTQVLGLEEEDDPVSLADELAYSLVWQIVQQESESPDSDYLDGLSMEHLRAAFQPETDFYLDENGNIVFWIQPGVIAGEIAGVMTFPFAPAEMLSALQ